MAVHRDRDEDLNVKQFSEFLIRNPFKTDTLKSQGTKYAEMRRRGKLVGVRVVDILSRSISSVYFFLLVRDILNWWFVFIILSQLLYFVVIRIIETCLWTLCRVCLRSV